MNVSLRPLAAVLVLAMLPLLALADTPSPDVTADEQLFKAAGLGTDGPGLMDFFRKRIPTSAQQQRYCDLIKLLGSDTFKEREQATTDLIAAGPLALAELRKALNNSDVETHRRAERCIEAIEKFGETAVPAAIRLLKDRKPEGAAAVLMEYLPHASEAGGEEEILDALVELGARKGQADPAIAPFLQDKAPVRRAAAALVLGVHGNAEQRKAVQPLLTDNDAGVRFRAAQGMIVSREKKAVPTLLRLLNEGPIELAYHAEDLLNGLAGEQAPKVGLENTENARRKTREAWDEWWQASEPKLDLSRIDKDVLFDRGRRSRALVQRVFDALIKRGGQPETKKLLKQNFDVPFGIMGEMIIEKREDLDKLIDEISTNAPQQKPSFSILRVDRLDDYVKMARDKEKAFLEKLPRSEVRVVVMRVQEGNQPMQTMGIFVRTTGGRSRIVGFGETKPDEKPK